MQYTLFYLYGHVENCKWTVRVITSVCFVALDQYDADALMRTYWLETYYHSIGNTG